MSPKNISTPIKHPKVSSITHEENEEIHNKLSKLDEQLNDLSVRSITSDELVNTQRKIQEMEKKMEKMENKMDENKNDMKKKTDENKNDMKKKMDENKEEIQKYMNELKNSMSSMIFHALYERLPKGDIKMQGIHENKENKVVETQSHMGSILSLLESTNSESQNHDHSLLQYPHHRGFNLEPRNYFIVKIDMRKFDGKYPIMWIF
jgi:chromosome segregation ATPase